MFVHCRGSTIPTRLLAGLILGLGLGWSGPAPAGELKWRVEASDEPQRTRDAKRAAELAGDFALLKNVAAPPHVSVTPLAEPAGIALPKAGETLTLTRENFATIFKERIEREVIGTFVLDYDKRVDDVRIEEDLALVGSLAVGRTVVVVEGDDAPSGQKGPRVTGVVLGGEPFAIRQPPVKNVEARAWARLSGGLVPGFEVAADTLGATGLLGVDLEIGPELTFPKANGARVAVLGGVSYVLGETVDQGLPLTASFRVLGQIVPPFEIGPLNTGSSTSWSSLLGVEAGLLVRPAATPVRVGADVNGVLTFKGPRIPSVRSRPTIGVAFGGFTYFGLGGGAQLRLRIGAVRG